MRVRAYDKKVNKYFISEVYAIINTGYYTKYLLLERLGNKRYFRLIDFLDKSNSGPIYPVNINVISSNALPEPWVSKTGSDLSELNDRVDTQDKNNSFYSFRGFGFIFEQKNLLRTLFKGDKVDFEMIGGNKKEVCTKLEGWNYTETEEDIQYLMKIFRGFHDSVLRTLNYISGSGKVENGMLVADHLRQISMMFDSDWSDSIEIVYEGVLALNLRPAKDNYSSNLFSASIILKDETIFFYDDDVRSEQEDYEGTWINALGMRWRLL